MSATTLFVIDRTDHSLYEAIQDVLCEETDRGYDAVIDMQGADDAKWYVQFDTKYTVDGAENAAERLSEELGCRVDVVEEWDNRDADEPGREAYSYERGVKVAEERTLTLPAGVEIVAVPIDTLRTWRNQLDGHPFPEVGKVITAIDALL